MPSAVVLIMTIIIYNKHGIKSGQWNRLCFYCATLLIANLILASVCVWCYTVIVYCSYYVNTLGAINEKNETTENSVVLFDLFADEVLHITNDRFVSFSIDTGEIENGLKDPSLRNQRLIELVSYLYPAYLRVGGTAADRLIFKSKNHDNNESCFQTETSDTFIMTDDEWEEINEFCQKTGFKLVFDLNVLVRNESGWITCNAKKLLDYSARRHYDIDWQLGNEPNSFHHVFEVDVPPKQLAQDFKKLQDLLRNYARFNSSKLIGPDVTAPKLKPHPSTLELLPDKYLREFLQHGGSKTVDVIAWHHYYLGADATVEDFLNPFTFESFLQSIDRIKTAISKGSASHKPLWLSETGSAHGGGAKNLSDRFISSFLWLDKLGVSAVRGLDVVVRQSLYGGNYALIDRHTLQPNTDYWISFIYKQLVKPKVLKIVQTGTKKSTLHLYAHCTENMYDIIVFGMNTASQTERIIFRRDRLLLFNKASLYLLTTSDLISQDILLNNKTLVFSLDGSPPDLHSIEINLKHPVSLPPYSMFFLQIINLYSHACVVGSRIQTAKYWTSGF